MKVHLVCWVYLKNQHETGASDCVTSLSKTEYHFCTSFFTWIIPQFQVRPAWFTCSDQGMLGVLVWSGGRTHCPAVGCSFCAYLAGRLEDSCHHWKAQQPSNMVDNCPTTHSRGWIYVSCWTAIKTNMLDCQTSSREEKETFPRNVVQKYFYENTK